MNDAVARIEAFFTGLAPADVARMGEFYTADATFKDPFNEVRGLPAIQRIFSHMYEALEQPRFVITTRLVDGPQCFLVWEFRFGFRHFHKGVEQVVRGGSHLLLAPDGRISAHRDYWDAAEELYEKLPVVGAFMRWLRRRASLNPS
ncbi:MAG: nuclear transport factor 2 family protein [Ramlibacter sp.]|nr:nuclear transport factor 2 family protein [Ramlibacter sp.]